MQELKQIKSTVIIKYFNRVSMFLIDIIIPLSQCINSAKKNDVRKFKTRENSKNKWVISIKYTSVFCPWKTHTVVHSPACRKHLCYAMIMIYNNYDNIFSTIQKN